MKLDLYIPINASVLDSTLPRVTTAWGSTSAKVFDPARTNGVVAAKWILAVAFPGTQRPVVKLAVDGTDYIADTSLVPTQSDVPTWIVTTLSTSHFTSRRVMRILVTASAASSSYRALIYQSVVRLTLSDPTTVEDFIELGEEKYGIFSVTGSKEFLYDPLDYPPGHVVRFYTVINQGMVKLLRDGVEVARLSDYSGSTVYLETQLVSPARGKYLVSCSTTQSSSRWGGAGLAITMPASYRVQNAAIFIPDESIGVSGGVWRYRYGRVLWNSVNWDSLREVRWEGNMRATVSAQAAVGTTSPFAGSEVSVPSALQLVRSGTFSPASGWIRPLAYSGTSGTVSLFAPRLLLRSYPPPIVISPSVVDSSASVIAPQVQSGIMVRPAVLDASSGTGTSSVGLGVTGQVVGEVAGVMAPVVQLAGINVVPRIIDTASGVGAHRIGMSVGVQAISAEAMVASPRIGLHVSHQVVSSEAWVLGGLVAPPVGMFPGGYCDGRVRVLLPRRGVRVILPERAVAFRVERL